MRLINPRPIRHMLAKHEVGKSDVAGNFQATLLEPSLAFFGVTEEGIRFPSVQPLLKIRIMGLPRNAVFIKNRHLTVFRKRLLKFEEPAAVVKLGLAIHKRR